MANKRIHLRDFDQLLIEKRSEQRRLKFQLQYVNSAIQQLKQATKAVQSRERKQRSATEGVKRGPGRPRKNPLPEEPQMKRGPGRPRKNPLPEQPAVKRGPGRPRKNPLPAEAGAVKRGPGRPRKNPQPEAAPVKRGPGRPRKVARA